MITCQTSCPIYSACKDKAEYNRCIFDYGLKMERGEEKDEFLERLTY